MRVLAAALIALPLALFIGANRNSPAPTAFGSKWAVVSTHPIASRIGADILSDGGNAVDAAVAVSFALAVVYPEAGNIGGGFFGVGHNAATNTQWMIDGRETAPLAITRDTFVELPPRSAWSGPYSTGIPGTVAALAKMHQAHGRKPWAELVLPAAKIAEAGFRLTEKGAHNIHRSRERLFAHEASRQQFFAVDPVTGAVLRQPDLAATLLRIAADPADFYTGETARLIVADAKVFGSPITAADLSGYEAKWRDPIRCAYRDLTIVSSAPPSSGGAILCQTAQILSIFEMSQLPPLSKTAVHLTAQAWGQAFVDRSLLGDPDVLELESIVHTLTTPGYGQRLGYLIDLTSPTLVTQPTFRPQSMETTHFSVVDAEGNAVAITTTLNGRFGNGRVVAGAGFLLNNEMDDFNARPGEPNVYGLVQGEANAPGPGRRMLSSMSPTLLFHGDKLVLVIGTPGGSSIPTQVWQALTYLIDHRWPLDRVIATPRFHYQGVPDRIMHEPAFPKSTQGELAEMGYALHQFGPYGDMHGIAWDTRKKRWMAVADPRGEGLPLAE
jgi:gamma-glutamyltranspeptidase / glutathione hydrolase